MLVTTSLSNEKHSTKLKKMMATASVFGSRYKLKRGFNLYEEILFNRLILLSSFTNISIGLIIKGLKVVSNDLILDICLNLD